jgi:hypothetical protein
MAAKFEAENLVLTTWLMIHRADALLKISEDKLFGEYKLNSERYAVLVTIQYLGGSAKPSEIARWLQRSPNSISMLADRMVRAGLIKRTRDRIEGSPQTGNTGRLGFHPRNHFAIIVRGQAYTYQSAQDDKLQDT